MCLGLLGKVERCVVGNEIGIGGWLDVWRVEAWDAGRCIRAVSAGQGGDCSTSNGTNRGRRKEDDWTNRWGDCSTLAGNNQGWRKERGQTPPRTELIEAGGRSVAGWIVEVGGDVLYYIISYYITLYSIILYYILLHYIILYNIIWYYIILYYIILYNIIIYYIILYHKIIYYNMLHYIYYIILYFIISYFNKSNYII